MSECRVERLPNNEVQKGDLNRAWREFDLSLSIGDIRRKATKPTVVRWVCLPVALIVYRMRLTQGLLDFPSVEA